MITVICWCMAGLLMVATQGSPKEAVIAQVVSAVAFTIVSVISFIALGMTNPPDSKPRSF
jgi:uncharacterized membrane protein YhiD involved in acid resistance